MKRAKIALSAIAILAVVGGAFAFKAQRDVNTALFSYNGTNCTVAAAKTYTTAIQVGQAGFTSTLYGTVSKTGVCLTTTWYTIE